MYEALALKTICFLLPRMFVNLRAVKCTCTTGQVTVACRLLILVSSLSTLVRVAAAAAAAAAR